MYIIKCHVKLTREDTVAANQAPYQKHSSKQAKGKKLKISTLKYTYVGTS